jgi:hypothetical protein
MKQQRQRQRLLLLPPSALLASLLLLLLPPLLLMQLGDDMRLTLAFDDVELQKPHRTLMKWQLSPLLQKPAAKIGK